MVGEYILDEEGAKRNKRVKTCGEDITEKLGVMRSLWGVEHKEYQLRNGVGNLDRNNNYGTILFELDRERQAILREAVALNMHLDATAVHKPGLWEKEKRLTCFKEYIGGLLEKYAAR